MTTCGIYTITHVESGRFYVGSSLRIERRWLVHKKHLLQGIHPNTYLQHIVDKYGFDSLDFKIIEVTDEINLRIREQELIQSMKPELNLLRDVSGVREITPELSRRFSAAGAKSWQNREAERLTKDLELERKKIRGLKRRAAAKGLTVEQYLAKKNEYIANQSPEARAKQDLKNTGKNQRRRAKREDA